MNNRAFAIKEAVTVDAESTVYRAARRSDGRPVLLKVLEKRPLRRRELEHLRNELNVAGPLDGSKVSRPISLETHAGQPALVREDFGGVPLEHFLSGPLRVPEFLDLAINIAQALEYVHQVGLVHKDLSPRSVFVQPSTGQVRLSEFGHATRGPSEPQPTVEPDLVEGTLAYMSPEQTGRTNRVVDSRSDLYSLGMLFFRMVTGELPFRARDPLEWVHAHLAQVPPSPATLSSSVPPTLAALVLRLLAKMPEDRYQSAHGVRHDLERIRAGLPNPEAFPLGEQDVSEHLKVSRRLYGRQAELALLRRELQQAADTGRPALVLISGYAGVGKSALVHEALSSIEGPNGTFLSGKFDAQRSTVPYSTIIQAFRRILRALLGGSEATLALWRARLQRALGKNGRLIAEMLPEVELILGPQPPLAPLLPREAEERFLSVLRAFIGAFGEFDSLLTLFLDDLQWADAESLKLLQYLLTDPASHHLLVIGAYRENDVDPAHPLCRAVKRMQRAEVHIVKLAIRPLGLEEVVALSADSVRREATEVRPLAELVYEKTGGNPFFINQFFDELYRDGLLYFDPSAWRWRWDLPKIRQHQYTENVAEFMVRRVAHLPRETRELVRLAACVGDAVDPQTLSAISGVVETELESKLLPALEQNFLLAGPKGYRFAHDRVQQAAYALVPTVERPRFHLDIGRKLLATLPSESLDGRLFEVVQQLNRGLTLVRAREERLRVAGLNLTAARKSRDAAAPAAAKQYLSVAIELLGREEGWETAYELLYAAHLIGAECAFLLGETEEARSLLDAIEQHARNVIDRASGRNLRVWLLASQGRLVEATEQSVDTARLLGLELPAPHDQRAIRRALSEAFATYAAVLRERSVESLADLPLLETPRDLTLIETLLKAIPGTFQWNPDLMALFVMKAVLLAAPDHRAPAFFYAQYGGVHARLTNDYETAFRFGELAIRLAERTEDEDEDEAGAHFLHGLLLCHLKRHISESIEHIAIARRLSLEHLDPVLARYSLSLGLVHRFYSGETLDTIRNDLDEAERSISQSGDLINEGFVTSTRQALAALKGQTSSLSRLDAPTFSEARFEASALPPVRALYGSTKVMVRFLGGDFTGALQAAQQSSPLPGLFNNAWHRFYRGLSLARLATGALGDERQRLLDLLAEDLRFIAMLAEHCPANHAHREQLLKAELAALGGDVLEALRLYDTAASAAREQGFLPEHALAHELAAYTLRAHGLESSADLHLREARESYRSWGAEGKARELEQRFPRALGARTLPEDVFSGAPGALDVIAVVKASQAISSELSWKPMSERLLEVALEQSGATYGCLLLKQNGSLLVAGIAHTKQQAITTTLLDLVPIEGGPFVPVTIVNLVARSREPLILDNPGASAGHSMDPYIRANQPRSVCCMPILRQLEVSAVLYLENRLTSGVFTSSRVKALELIAGQAAITLSNAQLFEKLERENAERRRVEVSLRESRGLLQQIIDNTSALIVVKDASGRFLLTNRRVDELLRTSHEHIVGKTDRDLGDPELAEAYRIGDQLALSENRPIEFEEKLELPGGPRTFITIKFPIRNEDGQPYAVCGVYTDITARKLSEDRLRESMAREHEARTQAEQAVQLRNEFLHVASHELRTPLTSLELAIYGVTRRIGSEADHKVLHSLEIAIRQVHRLEKLVSSLLDVSRIQVGRLELERRSVDLGVIVREAAEQLAEDVRRSGSTLTLHIRDPVIGSWDEPHMEQIVLNLLSNAIKFGQGKPIQVTVEARGGTAYLTVIDRGMGISEEARSHAFERFGRGVSSRHYGGLGLGLYIVRTIAEAHGGRVLVTSAPGQGAQFSVEIPQSPPNPEPQEAASRA